jgi:hypothetical protein
VAHRRGPDVGGGGRLTHELRINLTFKLDDEAVQALLAKEPGLAIMTLQGSVEKAVRRRLNEQLRKMLAELGGDPWHHFLHDRIPDSGPRRDGAVHSMKVKP